jgi:hypothetical protein
LARIKLSKIHQEYITAVMAALRPVFLAAAGISALGFVLTFQFQIPNWGARPSEANTVSTSE